MAAGTRISATEAARSFADVVNRVRYRGEEFIVEKAGEPVCRIGPAGPGNCTLADLAQLLARAPRADAGFESAVAEAVSNQGPGWTEDEG
jgi:prevent-host-death family protein